MNKRMNLEDFKSNTKEWFLEQLSNMPVTQALQTISDLSRDMFKPKFPKTYGECCIILNTSCSKVSVSGHKEKLIGNFQELLICRDAYWKIVGEQMGLEKPWEPDWTDNYQKKWTINFYQGEINLTKGPNVHFVLAFPTEEMRDAFYENFKGLIERCKELL